MFNKWVNIISEGLLRSVPCYSFVTHTSRIHYNVKKYSEVYRGDVPDANSIREIVFVLWKMPRHAVLLLFLFNLNPTRHKFIN